MVAIPLARPAIAAGMSLAMMETLADYGTVQYFGVSTFTTGIFRTWYGLGELQAAAQLSSLLLMFVFVLIVLERWSRHKMRYHHTAKQSKHLPRLKLQGWRGGVAMAICLFAVVFGFALPALQLLSWSVDFWREGVNAAFGELILHSFMLAAVASVCALALAVYLAYGRRVHPGAMETGAVRVAGMGYAIPGTVIAVGVLIAFAAFDNTLDAWMTDRWGISTGLLLSGTTVALIFAYVVRFLSVSLQTVESGLLKIKPSQDEAARSLGSTPLSVLYRIHLPVLRTSLMTASVLVFVDILKELPTTLILRPFNYNTLAVRAYELASDERLAEAGLPALAIVIIGLLPVVILVKAMAQGEPDPYTEYAADMEQE
jgi:iron(III) transport system permease protein